ncbi:MAG: hypothetical protein P8K80_00145 [Phycisphaerales bacterium]|nr:hypothetical protein [Phycisphaerales bacterium]
MDPVLVEQLVSFTIALVVGIVLWGLGVVVLRSAVALGGLVLGALMGWLTWVETGGTFPLWAVLLVFAVVVACVSLLIYRLLLAGLLAAILSMVSLVTLWSVLSMSATVAEGTIPEAGSTPAPLQDLGLLIIGSDATDPTEGDVDEAAPPSTDMHELLPAAARQAEMIRRELATRLEHLRGAWKELDATRQLVIVGSVLGGMLLGLIIATFAPRTTAVIVTAVLGSLLILGSISRLLSMAGAPMHDLIEAWILLPAVAWVALAVTGAFVQCMLSRRKASQSPDAS